MSVAYITITKKVKKGERGGGGGAQKEAGVPKREEASSALLHDYVKCWQAKVKRHLSIGCYCALG